MSYVDLNEVMILKHVQHLKQEAQGVVVLIEERRGLNLDLIHSHDL